jgi:hypothetical protein
MNTLLRCGFSALAAWTLVQASPASAAASHDGKWSVSVVTEQGACDAYRWDLGIAGGRIDERGFLAQASGQVDKRGVVNVVFTRGSDQLAATGVLNAVDGSGKWNLPNRQCSGRWKAEKVS